MENKNVPDDRTIYLTFNDIFKGSLAAIRRPSPIKKVFQQHGKRPGVAQVLNKYGLPAVAERVQWLLAERVFESTHHAKMMFPDLFQVSPAQSADRAASEAEAAAHQAQTLEEAVKEEEKEDEEEDEDGVDSGIENDFDADPHASGQPWPDLAGDVGPAAATARVVPPSLFPMYLPFATGHRILTRTQSILEAACFRFASETIPEVMTRRGWDCAESVELNVIVRLLLKHGGSLNRLEAAAAGDQEDLGALARSVTRLRHTTVHRGRVTARVLERFLADALSLAGRLGDRGATSALARTRRRVRRGVAELEDNKSMLEARLRGALDDIAARRAELDRLEGAVVADVLRADAEYQALIGASLEEAHPPRPGDWSDLGGALGEEGPGVAEGGSAVGGGDAEDYPLPGGCDTEGEEDCFEDALEHESGVLDGSGSEYTWY